MSTELLPYFEALNLLMDWCTVLLIIQTAIFITLIIIAMHLEEEKHKKIRISIIITVIFSALSILIGLNVLGTIPWSTQNLLSMVTKYHDIYQFRNYIGVPIWVIAFGQHVFFFLSMISLVLFIYKLPNNKYNK